MKHILRLLKKTLFTKKLSSISRTNLYDELFYNLRNKKLKTPSFSLFIISLFILRTPLRLAAFNSSLLKSILDLNDKNKDQEENLSKITRHLNKKHKDNPPPEFLVELSRICIKNKNYVLSLKLREKALETIIKGNDNKQKIKALFESGEIKKAHNLVKKYKFSFRKRKNIWSFLEWITNDSNRKNNTPFLLNKRKYIKNDNFFLKKIKNKKIAIVGPIESEFDQSEEIDGYDIVIRFNYLGKKRSSNSNLGTKIDISYYNEGIMRKISHSNIDEISRLSFIVLKKENKSTKEITKKTNLYRYIINKNKIAINGTFNAVPNALLDILCFSPKEIKVFGTDLFLTREYRMNYIGEKSIDTSKDFLRHDPITQYRIIDVLYKNNFIEVDQRLKRILEMGCENYLNNLESVWKT